MVYNKDDFKKHIDTLQIEGYELKSAIQAYLFIRILNNKTETITISFRDYTPHGFYIDGVSADIYFEEVEHILNPLYDKYKIEKRYGNSTIQKAMVGLRDVDYSKLKIEINGKESFNVVSQNIKKIINKGVLPFFEEFRTLQKVNEEINKLSEEELSNFISGITGIKVPLIKKLTGADDFKKELKERHQFYTIEVFKYPQYFKDHEKVFNELFAENLKAL
jgi:hypothetical protein